MIGIGITTRNRPHVLKSALEHFAMFHTNESKYVIVDDNSDSDKQCNNIVNDFASRIDATVILRKSKERLGIALAKNACLAQLTDCDHVFLFDDDAWPRKQGWSQKWINSCEVNNIHHSMYVTPIPDHEHLFREISRIGQGENQVIGWSNCFGVSLYFSRHCLNVIGGYDYINARNVYGYEHAQISKRAFNANLTNKLPYASPALISDWIYSVDISYMWHHQPSPIECEWIGSFASSVTTEEANMHEQNSRMMLEPQIHIPLVDPIDDDTSSPNKNRINVVIPTKSNFDGLFALLESMSSDESINEIVVIADGIDAYNHLLPHSGNLFTLYMVPLASGLHKMWNIGMDHFSGSGKHIAIINDDVLLSPNALSVACDLLDSEPDIGLVTPWSDTTVTDKFIETTGFAGFCMVISSNLVDLWRFDERMMWWYGDVDVIMWVARKMKRRTGLTGLCHATGNKSQTITNDPPPNFHQDIENDARLFHEKWDNYDDNTK